MIGTAHASMCVCPTSRAGRGAGTDRPAYTVRGHLATAVGALATRPRAASTHTLWVVIIARVSMRTSVPRW